MNGKPTPPSRVALYARVSSDKQAQEGTIDSQIACLREQIASAGDVLGATLCFSDDGVSGTTLVRPALERLRDQAAAGAFERLYILAPDRLARRHAHQMVLIEELQACGVELIFVNRPLGSTPEDQLLLQVQSVVAEYERAKILERTRRGRLHAARCGQVSVLSRAPFGYRYVDKHSGGGVAAYEVVEEEACIVRQMFSWVAGEGCSLREVARRLEKLGVPTRHGQSRWKSSTIASMLSNPSYYGQAAYGRTRVGERRPQLRPRRGQPETPKYPYSVYEQPATHHIQIAVPALVDADLFAAVQEQLAENQRRLRANTKSRRYLLQGLAVCSSCGYALHSKTSGRRRKKPYAYYRCVGSEAAYFGGQRICQVRSQRVEDLEAAVWKDVCNLLSEPERLRQEFERRRQNPRSASVLGESQRLRATLSKIKQNISRLLDAYADGLLETSEFEPRIKRLKGRLAKVNSELQAREKQAKENEALRLVCGHLDDFADQVKAGLETADWEQRRAILRALVKRVEVDNKNIRIVYKVPDRPFVKAPHGGILQDCPSRLAPGVAPHPILEGAFRAFPSTPPAPPPGSPHGQSAASRPPA
jgi:site-specific DNA recombinase